MLTTFVLCVICCMIFAVASRLYPEPLKEEARLLVWENAREPLRGEAHGHYRVLAAVVAALFILLYALFR